MTGIFLRFLCLLAATLFIASLSTSRLRVEVRFAGDSDPDAPAVKPAKAGGVDVDTRAEPCDVAGGIGG